MLCTKKPNGLFWVVILGLVLVVPYVLGNRYCRYACKWGLEVVYPHLSFTEKSMPDSVIRCNLDEYLSKISSYQFDKL